jgi:preprotein translocase subunit YajC
MPLFISYALAFVIIGIILYLFWKQQQEKKSGQPEKSLMIDLTAAAK